jgi:hypothetical protein
MVSRAAIMRDANETYSLRSAKRPNGTVVPAVHCDCRALGSELVGHGLRQLCLARRRGRTRPAAKHPSERFPWLGGSVGADGKPVARDGCLQGPPASRCGDSRWAEVLAAAARDVHLRHVPRISGILRRSLEQPPASLLHSISHRGVFTRARNASVPRPMEREGLGRALVVPHRGIRLCACHVAIASLANGKPPPCRNMPYLRVRPPRHPPPLPGMRHRARRPDFGVIARATRPAPLAAGVFSVSLPLCFFASPRQPLGRSDP